MPFCKFMVAAIFVCLSTSWVVAEEQVDYLRDVRPILARHCLKCHGPDDAQRQGGLRLDERDSALAAADSGEPAIVPQKSAESELIRRILSADEAEVMPPPEIKNPLTAEQKQTLQRWIDQGAEYQPHWSFALPKQSPAPEVRQADWLQGPIDSFVLARLEREGLSPSEPATAEALVRRVFLDLIGLPPTVAEVDAVLSSEAPDAYERLVDRLVATPQYGERWARRWMDLARYADTNGYEKDRPRSIWPYRDWLIGALNADLPFDQFTIEQLAGDMLPNATEEQRIATGFHRNTMLNEEGGIDPQEFRFYSLVDRVSTTSTVWLGLTLGCAQCHTHKYDPIPHQDYYRFLALFNNAEEPELELAQPAALDRRQRLEQQIADRMAALPSAFPLPADETTQDQPAAARRQAHLEAKFAAWLAEQRAKQIAWTSVTPTRAASELPRLQILEDGTVLASGDQSKRDVYTLTLPAALPKITAIRLEALPDPSLPKNGPGRIYYEGPAGDFFLSEFKATGGGQALAFSRASQSFASGNSNASAAMDGNPLTGWSINGGQGARHEAVFQLTTPLAAGQPLELQLIFERYYAAGLGRFRVSVTSDEQPNLEATPAPHTVQTLLLADPQTLSAEDRQTLQSYYLTVSPELAEERKAIEALRKQMPALPTTLVMRERPADHPRQTHLHKRGEFLQPAEEVSAGVLSILPALPPEQPANRLTLARWFMRPEHPLTGRVTVNRHWGAFFGRGIVATTEDFGFQGDLPTHPELLDWLAIELPRQEWSIKHLHRMLVTSATYQQSSRLSPELAAKDPENRLLARGPTMRLDAEIIRDSALRVSGLLSTKLGGPSVFPPQPASITTEGAYGQLAWNVSQGQDRFRRTLYTFSKRTAPFALSTTFDAPSGEACLARREISNTPLQALSLLNDTTFIEVAQALGSDFASQTGTTGEKAARLFRQCLTRTPAPDELQRITAFYDQQEKRLNSKELDAAAIAGPGGGENPTAAAAWTLVARAILNLDEMVAKR